MSPMTVCWSKLQATLINLKFGTYRNYIAFNAFYIFLGTGTYTQLYMQKKKKR